MTNGNRPQNGTPPYVSYKSWETFLIYLKADLMPVPDRLDTSLWQQAPLSGFSGTTRSGLIGALQFLGLTDSNRATLGRLTNLAEANTEEAQQRILKSLFDERYLPILEEVDAARATRQQLNDKFRKAGCTNTTAEKAVTFFVNFARDAGIEVHPNLFRRSQGTRTRKKSATERKESGNLPENNIITPKIEILPENTPISAENGANYHDRVHPAVLGFLELLPKDGKVWTTSDREKFKHGFTAALDLAYPTIDDASPQML